MGRGRDDHPRLGWEGPRKSRDALGLEGALPPAIRMRMPSAIEAVRPGGQRMSEPAPSGPRADDQGRVDHGEERGGVGGLGARRQPPFSFSGGKSRRSGRVEDGRCPPLPAVFWPSTAHLGCPRDTRCPLANSNVARETPERQEFLHPGNYNAARALLVRRGGSGRPPSTPVSATSPRVATPWTPKVVTRRPTGRAPHGRRGCDVARPGTIETSAAGLGRRSGQV